MAIYLFTRFCMNSAASQNINRIRNIFKFTHRPVSITTHSHEFTDDTAREEMRVWLMSTFSSSLSLAANVLRAIDDMVVAAKVATVILRAARIVVVAYQVARENDVRVEELCMRLSELYSAVDQVRIFLAKQATAIVAGEPVNDTANAQRVRRAVSRAQKAIDSWNVVSCATGAKKWAMFKKFVARAARLVLITTASLRPTKR